MNEWLQYSLSLLLTIIFVASIYSRSPFISKKLFHKYICVASHYTIVRNNSSFMFKYSIFYKPETIRVLTVLVQVSTLDNILMYSYVHNICLYCSLPCWRNVNFKFICFVFGRPWVQSQIKDWTTFTADFHCFLQTLCKCRDIISNYAMDINFHTCSDDLSLIFTSVNTVQHEILKALLQKWQINTWKSTGISWFMLFVWVQVYQPLCSFPHK